MSEENNSNSNYHKYNSLNNIRSRLTKNQKSSRVKSTFFGTATNTIESNYQPDRFENSGPYRAVVLKVNQPVEPPPNHPLRGISDFLGLPLTKVKSIQAKIIDYADTALPFPDKLGDDPGPHQNIIFLHKTYLASTVEANEANVKAGDIVLVDFMDRKNQSDPIFIGVTSVGGLLESLGALYDNLKQIMEQLKNGEEPYVGTTGKCGRVHPEEDCIYSKKIRFTMSWNYNTASSYQEMIKKLDVMVKYNKTAGGGCKTSIESYSTAERTSTQRDASGNLVSASNGGTINIVYDFGSFSGHSKFASTVEEAMKKIASTVTPDVAGLIRIGSTLRNPEEQASIRRARCLPPNDPRCTGSTPCAGLLVDGTAITDEQLNSGRCDDPHCNASVCPGNGTSTHERGEAVDFCLAQLKETNGSFSIYYPGYAKRSQNPSVYDAALSSPSRMAIKNLGNEIVVNDETLPFKPLSEAIEFWHWSTNGY